MILIGDCIQTMLGLPDGSVHTCVTSPPYFGLRDYGHEGQIGLEDTPEAFVARLVEVFREVRRVLRDDGTLWLNLGDSYVRNPGKGGSGPGGKNIDYSGSYTAAAKRRNAGANVGQRAAQLVLRNGAPGVKEKNLIGIPWRVAFALQADGWYLRQDIIWHKPNPMPESVRDRCTKAHEYIFLLSKGPRYYFDADAIREPAAQPDRVRSDRFGGNKYVEGVKHSDGSIFTGSETRNKRSVWTVTTKPFKGAHFATFPTELIEPCILAGCPEGGTVLDPFLGSGTTAAVAVRHRRDWIGCELNPEYAEMAAARIAEASRFTQDLFAGAKP